MTIQEFSLQLGREEHPSQLIRALQTLRDTDQMRWAGDWIPWGEDEPRAYATGWYPWPDFEPSTYAEQPELRS